ncbi:MAG: hypothetical protein AAFO85_15100 [Cyanobacteria bacterium J06598_4]
MVKRKRVSLSVRLQPYSGTLMAEVASWLNSVERDEAKKLIEAALIMAYLPYARANSGVERAEIERCCWETQDLLDKHGFNLRQVLQVPQPQWRLQQLNPSNAMNAVNEAEVTEKEEAVVVKDEEVDSPSSKIEGKGSYEDVDALFGDD